MKPITLIAILFSLLFHSTSLFAADVFAEYKMTGIGDKINTTRMYFKDGDLRTEVIMKMGEMEMTSVTLNLKSNPDFMISYNSQSKTYTEIKKNKETSKAKAMSITVLGNEKIGSYNCTHVRMTSDTTSWDMWVTKDLPQFDFPVQSGDEAANRKVLELLKSKSADGVPVKMVFFKPHTETPIMTMELVKYNNKDLEASLFKIPEGYTKSTAQFDAEKMKSMSPEERKEMIQKMMEQYKQKN